MPERLPEPEVVFFDLFGTIFKWSKSPRFAMADALKSAGLTFDPAAVYARQREMWRVFPPRDEYPSDNEWQYWRHYDTDLLKRLGVAASPPLLDAIRSEFEANVRLELQDDALPALQALKEMGVRVGAISNATFGMRRDFDRLGLPAYFETVVFSQAVKARKPDPHIFLLALSKVGCPPTRAWMVGDDPETDVRGAQGVGIVPILIDREAKHTDTRAPRISDLRQVPELYKAAEP